MLKCSYEVERIDGDYAMLRRTDNAQEPAAAEEQKQVARALLPAEIKEGDKLLYEFMQYRIV